jgi:anti-sigma regulatory factor (Ser/Thr protein kinase)
MGEFVIRDEGPGFDPASLPDPTDPENIEKACGRGLLLMRTFMDKVDYNRTGNQVTLTKRANHVRT